MRSPSCRRKWGWSTTSRCSRSPRFKREPQIPPLRYAPVGGCDFFNFLWPESCEEHLPISIAGVLRLRAVSPVLSDRSAKRFAQDDDSVVGIKNIGSSSKNTKSKVTSTASTFEDSRELKRVLPYALHRTADF